MQPNPTLLRTHQALSGFIAGLIVILAVLAGRHLNFGGQIIETHGYLGNSVFLFALVNLGLTLVLREDGRSVALVGMIALLTFSQIGLGYVGRNSQDAAALHIPSGVALMGLSGYQYARARFRPRLSDSVAE